METKIEKPANVKTTPPKPAARRRATVKQPVENDATTNPADAKIALTINLKEKRLPTIDKILKDNKIDFIDKIEKAVKKVIKKMVKKNDKQVKKTLKKNKK